MSSNLVNVGIADTKVAGSPGVLRTILGSCVGICLYDEESKVSGLAHIMLPVRNNAESNPKKYADTAIPELIEMMEEAGAKLKNMVAKIIGGATMFQISENSMMGEIGKNNIKKVRDILSETGIEIIAEDVGGDFGRTIDFFSDTGKIKIKSLGRSDKII